MADTVGMKAKEKAGRADRTVRGQVEAVKAWGRGSPVRSPGGALKRAQRWGEQESESGWGGGSRSGRGRARGCQRSSAPGWPGRRCPPCRCSQSGWAAEPSVSLSRTTGSS